MVTWVKENMEIITLIMTVFVSVVTSFGVAIIYTKSESDRVKRKQFKDNLYKSYIENGIMKVQESMNIFGASTAFALLDLVIYCRRVYNSGEPPSVLEN